MKRLFRKNQMIVTTLAALIAVAGYLNYTDKAKEVTQVSSDTYDSVYSADEQMQEEEDIESPDDDGEDIEETTAEPGAAVLTNGTTVSSFMVQARLDREQTRSKNKETLLEVINNESVKDSQKKKAVKSMTEITEISEMENIIETLLKAKGFSDIVVTLSESQADVIVSSQEADDSKRVQIENVIKRKTGLNAEDITITPAG